MRLSPRSEPQPDVSLLRSRTDEYANQLARPEDALLVVEVADSILRYDRDVKVGLYAAADIPEL